MATKRRGLKKGTGILFIAALFIGAGMGEILGNSSLGWQLGLGAGLLVIATLRTWREQRFSPSALALTVIGLYMILQRFLPDDIESYLTRYGYLAIGLILGAIGIGYLVQSPDDREE